MSEVKRKSVLAVVKEVTNGTPVAPTSGAQYVPLREDFEFSPNFEQLENDELSDTIDVKAPILGIEQPEGSLSVYVRHSGVEATAPAIDKLLENAFGSKVAAGTQRDTVAGSTAGTATAAAILNVDTGEGVEFERGEALLIKDGTNGYSIRNVHSVSGDALTLGFNLANAPASGVNLGRAILYKPGDDPSALSMWLYRGNGAAVELMAGSQISEFSLEANAGELLSGSFNFAGTSYYFDPIVIAATDQYLDFTDDDGTWAAVVAVGTYKDPHDLAAAIQASMRSVSPGETATVTYSDSTGKFNIKTTGTVLSLLWNTGANTANTIGDKIGFLTAADDTGTAATTGYTSDNAQSWASPYTPTADSNVNPLVIKSNQVMLGDFDDYGCAGAQSFTATLSKEQIDIKDICADSGVAEKRASSRQLEINMVITLARHDADKFRRFRQGLDVRFAFNGGIKDGGNWVAGRCVNLYVPTMKIAEHLVSDVDGVVTFEITLRSSVGSDNLGTMYFNLL